MIYRLILVFIFLVSTTVFSSDKKEVKANNNSTNIFVKSKDSNKAPNFALKSVKGKTVKLSDYKGKIVIIDFWATWCPPCRKGIPDLIELKKEFKDDGFEIIGISLDDITQRGTSTADVGPFMKDYGINYSWVNTSDLSNIEKAINANTKMVFLETPTNPMLNLTDLEGAARICNKNNLISVVDNTFMSPYFQNPLTLGCDIVLHSQTKYINGHSDVISGILITSSDKIHERLRYIQNATGGVPSPFDCWLILRSTKTLAVRMERHNVNAMEIANFLVDSKLGKKVYYPGLPVHPQHELAKKQMRGFGGMISCDLGDIELTKKLLKNVKIFTLGESLGGVESLINHPASMTHASVPKEDRDAMGLTESLVRFSVGIEDVEDLIDDIKQAIK